MENNQKKNELNVDKLMKVLSEIMSEKYGCEITIRAIPKDKAKEQVK